jgi:methylmalonyl-CoA/ethylmalonyl-CoA epimerase
MRSLPLLLLSALTCFSAEPPDFYKSVSRVSWVVRDLDRTMAVWSKFGVADVEQRGEVALPVEFRGKPATAKVRWISGWMGGTAIDFFQPLEGGNAYAEFLEKHGEGIFALMYAVPSEAAYRKELGRMQDLGVGVLQQGVYEVEGTAIPYAYLDTVAGGKYSLALVYFPPDAEPSGYGPVKFSQFAFVVRDLRAVSDYWQKLGFPAIETTHPQLRDLQYRGKPAHYEQTLGWMRHGSVPFEFCPPPKGRSVYSEYLEQHGEGIQHVGINVDDMDREIAQKGFAVLQAGAWGEPGKPGSGRFAYLETAPDGGITVELLWNYK